jgi:hypothetical protein
VVGGQEKAARSSITRRHVHSSDAGAA